MSDGFDERTAYGFVDGFDDPSMGWARYAQVIPLSSLFTGPRELRRVCPNPCLQAMKHFNLNSGLFYLRANDRTVDLMHRLETRLAREKYWDQTAYNEEIFFLSHGDYKSPQVRRCRAKEPTRTATVGIGGRWAPKCPLLVLIACTASTGVRQGHGHIPLHELQGLMAPLLPLADTAQARTRIMTKRPSANPSPLPRVAFADTV